MRKGISTKNNPHTAKDINEQFEFFEAIKDISNKEERIRAYRKEVSRLASLANKRVSRLESNDLESTPAYQTYLKSGGEKFSVKGKDYNEVQQELSKLKKFLSAKTSTVKGANNTLKEIAANTGIKYKNLKELKEKSAKFFELSSMVEQYLRTVEDMASAIGYQKIWEAINVYTKEAGVDLSDASVSVEDMIENVTKAIKEYEEPTPFISGWYSLTEDDIDNNRF